MQIPATSNTPHVPVTPNDLAIIHQVMHPYKVFLQHRVPHSEKRQTTMLLLDHLCFRIAFTLRTLAAGKEAAIVITVDEAGMINNALGVFITLLETVFPQDVGRDLTITDCKQLREKLAPVLAPGSAQPQRYH
jgi:hypothetical protein